MGQGTHGVLAQAPFSVGPWAVGPVPAQQALPTPGGCEGRCVVVGSSSYRVSGFRVRTGVVELAGRDVWGCSPTPTPAGREVKTRVPPWERSRQGGTSKPKVAGVPPPPNLYLSHQSGPRPRWAWRRLQAAAVQPLGVQPTCSCCARRPSAGLGPGRGPGPGEGDLSYPVSNTATATR